MSKTTNKSPGGLYDFKGNYVGPISAMSTTVETTGQNVDVSRKDMPLFSGVMTYFPDALLAISVHSKRGNDKYNPGQPLHWDRFKSADHADCIARHLLDIGPTWDAMDGDTQSLHAAALAWRSLALLQIVLERKANK